MPGGHWTGSSPSSSPPTRLAGFLGDRPLPAQPAAPEGPGIVAPGVNPGNRANKTALSPVASEARRIAPLAPTGLLSLSLSIPAPSGPLLRRPAGGASRPRRAADAQGTLDRIFPIVFPAHAARRGRLAPPLRVQRGQAVPRAGAADGGQGDGPGSCPICLLGTDPFAIPVPAATGGPRRPASALQATAQAPGRGRQRHSPQHATVDRDRVSLLRAPPPPAAAYPRRRRTRSTPHRDTPSSISVIPPSGTGTGLGLGTSARLPKKVACEMSLLLALQTVSPVPTQR